MRSLTRRAPRPRPTTRIAPHDVQFGARMRAWRAQHGVTQTALLHLMRQHAGYAPGHKGAISRIEHGLAWATLPLVDAMAHVDAAFGGKGRSYWGWGDVSDPTLTVRPTTARTLRHTETSRPANIWREPEMVARPRR